MLRPDAPGAGLLWQAVQDGASLRASPLSDTPLVAVAEAAQRVYCESSGSTGAPKLIRRNPESWITSFDINQRLFDLDDKDAYAVLGHLGHSLSLYAALEGLHIGAGLALLSDLGPKQQAVALRDLRVTTIYATPSQMQMIIRADLSAFPDVKRILVGGGRLNGALRATLADRFPKAHIHEFFGASETSFITMSDADTPAGSVGRAYPDVQIQFGASDVEGDIWVKSPLLFDGYEQGDSALTEWRDGYVSIGEIGRLDGDGYLYLMGRKSRMVTVADQNVYPEAIEAVLADHPGVRSAAVITPADTQRGHVIVAVVVGKVDDAELRKACRDALGDAAVPRSVWVIKDMPILAAGKPDLQKLETLWQERRV